MRTQLTGNAAPQVKQPSGQASVRTYRQANRLATVGAER